MPRGQVARLPYFFTPVVFRGADACKIDQMTPDLALNDEVGQLRKMIVAMRGEMETARTHQQDAVQKATTAGHGEIMELRETIRALRDELEKERARHCDELQEINQANRSEQQQLQQMIVALRQELEAALAR